MSRRILAALVAVLVVAGAAACSSKGSDDVSTATTETVSGATSDTAAPDTTTGGGAEGADTTDTTADAASIAALAGEAGSRAGACPTQAEVDTVQAELEAASGGSVTDVDSLAAEYDAAFSFLAAYLPADKQADLDLVRNAFSGYVQALSGVDLSNPDALSDDQKAALDAAGQQFDTPEVEAANTRIEEYFTQTCPDVNFDDGGSSTDGSTGN